jgi:hypothetical protein
MHQVETMRSGCATPFRWLSPALCGGLMILSSFSKLFCAPCYCQSDSSLRPFVIGLGVNAYGVPPLSWVGGGQIQLGYATKSAFVNGELLWMLGFVPELGGGLRLPDAGLAIGCGALFSFRTLPREWLGKIYLSSDEFRPKAIGYWKLFVLFSFWDKFYHPPLVGAELSVLLWPL